MSITLLKASAFAIASYFVLSNGSEAKQLREYSDEQIISEYHMRLDKILDQVAPINDRISEHLFSVFEEGLRNWDGVNDTKFAKLTSEFAQAAYPLFPFAKAGNYEAEEQTAVGALGVFGQGNICDFIHVSINAARKGGASGASSLRMLYEIRTDTLGADASPAIIRKLQLWTLEAAQRDYPMRGRRDAMLSTLTAAEKEELTHEWMNWTPYTDSYEDLFDLCALFN